MDENSTITFDELGMAYGAAGALFTALAFGLAFFSISDQQNDLSYKTTLDVFMKAFNSLRNDPQFLKSRDYVFSKHFINDLALLKKRKTDDTIFISLEDFLSLRSEAVLASESSIRRVPYNSLIYFCDQMEYLGVLVTHKYFDNSMLDYFGPTIVGSYNKLSNLIEESRKLKNDCSFYIHFTKLYDLAERRRPDYMKECQEYINKRSSA